MYLHIKRGLDAVVSALCILCLSPVFLVLALSVKLSSKGPVLFKQERIGKDKKHFQIWKFRTMRTDTPKDCPTHLLKNPDQYITRIGAFLRKTSLDELPQFFNIYAGQMSFVGPRPALYNQYDLISERDRYNANAVRPGLTGLAQVNGRDELPISKKAALDGQYVQSCSLALDIRIFFMTFFKVLRRDGVVEGAVQEEEKSKDEVTL